ncbi:snRNA-activating protein complex subunit 4 [Symphorus nematophorus]
MSVSLSAERDRIQRQVEELEQSLSATHTELELLSSETDDESDDDDHKEEKEEGSAAGLLAQREKIQREIQHLENVLGPHSPVCVSDEDSSSSSDESELGLSLSVDSCLQMNLVYQQVLQETLDELETLLTHNHRQQEEVVSQLSGPIKESSREPRPPPSSCQQAFNMFLGRFLKPYFKDKLTGLGPPANQETKEKASRMTGCLDNNVLKLKRWESWQKTLLIHSVAKDGLRRLIQPKLSRSDYLSQKLYTAEEADKQQLQQQIESLEREIHLLREKKEDELIGDRYEEHDWQKISNVDFEGTRDAEDIRRFWQNFLHPSISKSGWSKEEVQQLRDVSRRHQERDWESIAAELGTGRTAFLCLQTFQRFVSDSLRHGSWTPAEDALLRELVDKMRIGNFIPYTQMSYFMEGRDPAQIIYRWSQVLDPSLKKGPWTPQEDQLLLQAVARYGEKDWWKIRLDVPGRTDGSCRDRYYDCLKPDTKRGPFDEQEQKLLMQLVEKYGVGRWAKIAAEIPHRVDAQCLRAWRSLNKQLLGPSAKKKRKPKKPPVRSEAPKKKQKQKKEDAPAKKRIRRRLVKIKEEEDEKDVTSEEEMVVEYMDSEDEEKKKTKVMVEALRTEEEEKEEEKEPYSFPPIREWIPAEKSESFTFLNFRPVELPSSSSGHVRGGKPVRSTILGQFGRSVIIGPNPRELPWEERHSRSAMMMVAPDQLRAHLCWQADIFNKQNLGTVPPAKQTQLCRLTERGLDLELQVAVTPWIGNVMIPAKTKLTAADILRERGEKTCLSSTAIFLLLLQSMNVDSVGCKEMIERRRSHVALWNPPQEPVRRKPDQKTKKTKNPRTVAELLAQREAREEQQEVDQQHKLILEQLQLLQQHKQQQLLLRQQPQQLILLQQPPPPCHLAVPPSPRSMSVPSPNCPRFLLQMSPKMPPQMSPVSFPPAVFNPQPVPQTRAVSINHLTSPPPALRRSPPAMVLASPAPQRLNVPPVSVVPASSNTTSASSHQQPGPQNLIVAPPPSPNQSISIGSTQSNQYAVPSTSSSTISFSRQSCPAPGPSAPGLSASSPSEDHHAVCSSQYGVNVGGACDDAGGANTVVDVSGDSVMKEGRRIRKLSPKAKALQEATEAKAEAKKKSALSPRKRLQIQNCLPQTVLPLPRQEDQTPQLTTPPAVPQLTTPTAAPQRPPPAAVISSEAPSSLLEQQTTPPPISVNSSPTDTTMSSTQNLDLAPPPSLPTDQNTASSTSSQPTLFYNDHDYASSYSDSSQQSPAHKQTNRRRPKPDPAPKKPSKAPTTGRKRGREEEQPRETSSQDEAESVGRTGDTVGGAGDAVSVGLTQEGKRIRKPSMRARALQEAAQQKAEAKKKRISSSPRKNCSQTSRSKKVTVQNQSANPLPGLCLQPGQSMWVMTPAGLVQLAQAPAKGLELAFVPSAPFTAPPGNNLTCQQAPPPLRLPGSPRSIAPQRSAVSVPIKLPSLSPRHAPPTCPPQPLPPGFFLQPVQNPASSPLPFCSPKFPPVILPCKGMVRMDPMAPPHLRREALQFDPSLMFVESQAEVRDWLSSLAGVVVPGAGVALPYLPPFVSSLSTLSALLQAKKSLTSSSLQLLSGESDTPATEPDPKSSTETMTNKLQDLPDSTSDLRPAPSVSSDLLQEEMDEAEEVELILSVRQLVAERFSCNPAYQLLKARFLSCFTVPAVLATVEPITEQTVNRPANEEKEKEGEEEEEEEEDEYLKKIKERGKRRKAVRSLLLCGGSGAPANHFSGINTDASTSDQTGPDQTGPDQTGPDQTGPN